MWAQQSLSNVRGRSAGIGERISLGGVGVRGFALEAAGDPDIWESLSLAQQTWIANTLAKLNELIVKSTGTTCPQWTPTIHGAGFCFQQWVNNAKLGLTKADGSPLVLRTDGLFDQETLDALITVAGMNPKDFPNPYPAAGAAPSTKEEKGLSVGAMTGIGLVGAGVLGGVIYAATRGGKRSRRR